MKQFIINRMSKYFRPNTGQPQSHWQSSANRRKQTLFPIYLKQYIKNDVLEVMANGSLDYTVKGICMGMKVTWNYTPPTNGGDTFTSIKKVAKQL